MKLRMFLPQIFILTIAISVFVYLATRFADWAAGPGWAYALATLAWFASVMWGQLRLRQKHVAGAFSWIMSLVLGAGMTFFLYVFLGQLTEFIPWPYPEGQVDRARAIAVIVLSAVTCVVGFFQATRGPSVVRVDVPIANLPAAFEGFAIAQISDLHVSHTIGRAYVEQVVARTRELRADLIALTGDFADGFAHELREDIAPLAELTARHGKYFVTGNHEYYWGVEDWVETHRSLGARVLLNEHVVLHEGGERLVVAGVTDIASGALRPDHRSSPKEAFRGAPEGAPRILLAHQPSSLRQARHEGVALQLSGHTHGGQWFPAWIFVRLAQRYLQGLYRSGDAWIYVNRGTGYWGPPLRFLVSPEITLLTLRRRSR